MTALRQDAWTEEDDMLLAEVTLRHIREGSTQLAAFEEVAEKLGRTPAACGFRWNSCVRKNYEAAIQIAKAQRQGLKKRRRQPVQLKSDLEKQSDSVASLSTIIRFLRQHKQDYAQISKQVRQLENQLSEREAELEKLRAEHEQLKKHVDTAQADYESINEDYKALIKIIERARKLALLDEEEEKPKFKMDVNGNLERIDK